MKVLVGALLTLLGVYMAVALHEPHFYTPFSIGMAVLFESWYRHLTGRGLFVGWRVGTQVIFWIILLLVSIGVDQAGVHLGYWIYPAYTSLGDEVIKFVFEWTVALCYVGLAFGIGFTYLKRAKVGTLASLVGAFVFFLFPIGLLTDYLNLFADSWVVLKMPFTNLSIGGFFVIFQTVGYAVMAFITLSLYWSVSLLFREKNLFRR